MAYNGSHFAPRPEAGGASESVRAPRPVASRRRATVNGGPATGRRSAAGARASMGGGTPGGRRPRAPKRRFAKRSAAALVLACVLGVLAVGGTLAWLVKEDIKQNFFDIGEVQVSIEETFDPSAAKKNVFVKNEGSVPAYVRAQVNIYWVDANGNQLWETPVKGIDYTVAVPDIPADTGWAKGADGLYYWKTPLKPGDTTKNLINEIEDQREQYNDGRRLVVDIAVQSIQYEPASAVHEAWGVTVENEGTDQAALKTENGQVVVSRSAATTGASASAAEGEE